MDKTITIFEGPDGAGKSTTIAKFRFADAVISHHGPYPGETEIASRYLKALRPAWERHASAILDRSWFSEPIYGVIYRNGMNRISTAQRRVLERVALTRQGVFVLCHPSRETVLSNWRQKHRIGEEYLTSEALLTKVYEIYGSLASRAAYGDHRTTALPMVTYDYESETIGDLRTKLEEARRVAYRPSTQALLVGDRPNSRTETIPFAGLAQGGCSAWLAEQLETAGIGEERLSWINAYTVDDAKVSSSFIATLRPVEILALGGKAGRWCQENHLKYRAAPHPQFWKRFHHREVYPLIKELQHALSR